MEAECFIEVHRAFQHTRVKATRAAFKRTLPGHFLCYLYAVRSFRELLIIKVEINMQLVPAVDIHAAN